MNNATAYEVKEFVVGFFRQRGITQAEIGETLALGRQTVSNILSNRDAYFNEKHAVLFSLGYGFSKNYLIEGEGFPMRAGSLLLHGYNTNTRNALEIIFRLFRDCNQMSLDFTKLLEHQVADANLLGKFSALYTFINTVLTMPDMNDEVNLLNVEYAKSAENLAQPLLRDIKEALQDISRNQLS